MVVVVVVVVVGGCAFAAAGVVDSIWKSDPEPERLVLIRQGQGCCCCCGPNVVNNNNKISYSSPLRPPSRLFSIPLGQQHRGLDFLEPLEMIAC